MSTKRTLIGLTAASFVVPLTTMVSHSFGRTSYPLLLPAIKDDLGLSNARAGFASTILFVAYLLGVLVVTVSASRTEPITTLRIGLLTCATGLGLLSMANSFALLVLGLTLASAGGAGIWITAPLLATREIPPKRRGLVIGFLTGSVGLANSAIAIGTKVARSSTGNDDLWRPIYFWMAAITLLILLLVLTLVQEKSPETQQRTGSGRPGMGLMGLRQMPGWKAVTLGYVAFGVIASGFATFLAEALEEDGGLSRDSVALVYIGLGFGSLIGAPLIGLLSDRTSRKTALITVMFIMGATSAVVALAEGWLLFGTVLLFGGLWASYPTLTATYVRDHLDDRVFGQAYGMMTIFYGTAAIIPPYLAGSIADKSGSFTIPYLLVALVAVVGVAILTRLPRPVVPAETAT